jgi:hypothetical protein
MNKNKFLKLRLYFTAIVTLAMWGFLARDHYHGGVPAHHILAKKDMPAISNWWGGILLPSLTWFLLYRIQNRIDATNKQKPDATEYLKPILYKFAAALLFGIVLSVFFTVGNIDMPGYMVLAIFLLALFFPMYRSEYLLGFVIGMTFTFGGVIPTVAGSIILSFCAIIYLVIRPAILYVAAKVTHTASSNK